MLVVILIIFGLCWLPYHAYFILAYYHPVSVDFTFCLCGFYRIRTRLKNIGVLFSSTQAVASHPSTQHIFLIFFWLAMANSAINPIIYFIMSAR